MTSDPFKQRAPKPQVKQALVLTQNELNRLISHSQSQKHEEEKEQSRIAERKERQEATEALSKRIAQRREPGSELRKRLHAQAAKNAHQELERERRIEARKHYVLDLAYKRLFEETDRVKQFKIAKNLASTMKQRDMEVTAKEGMSDMIAKYEAQFLLGILRDVESYRNEEKAKVDKEKKNKLKNAENWRKQREEKEKRRKQAEWEHLRDGYVVREAAAVYAEEVNDAAFKQKRKIKEYKTDLDKQTDQKQAIAYVHAQLDEADEKRAKIFNEAKINMKIKHQAIKKELDKRKEEKRNYVAMNLKDKSCAITFNEETILQKAILQAETKYQDDCAIKQANQEAALKSIQDFYEKEMTAKAKREFEEQRQGFQERREIMEHVDEQQQVENSKILTKQNMEKEAQHLQLHQIAKRRMDKKAEKLDEMKDYLNHMRSLNDEEEVFQKYAQMEIADCEARGIDTRPMRVAARPGIECGKGPLYEKRGQIRPKYYSSISKGDELNHIKRDENRPDSKSRLGFILH